MDENTRRRKEAMLITIVSKLRSSQAVSLADEELERCFEFCAGRKVLIKYAKEFRDSGYMTQSHLSAEHGDAMAKTPTEDKACPICNHKEHKPGQCKQCNCGEAELSKPGSVTNTKDLDIDRRGPATNKGHRVPKRRTDNK